MWLQSVAKRNNTVIVWGQMRLSLPVSSQRSACGVCGHARTRGDQSHRSWGLQHPGSGRQDSPGLQRSVLNSCRSQRSFDSPSLCVSVCSLYRALVWIRDPSIWLADRWVGISLASMLPLTPNSCPASLWFAQQVKQMSDLCGRVSLRTSTRE